MKKSFQLLLGIVGLIAAVLWAVNGVPYSEIVQSFRGMNSLMLGTVFFLTLSNLLIRAFVWKHVAGTLTNLTVKNALSSYLFGVFSNLILPFKLGDVAQGYALGKRQCVNTVSAVSAVLIQRIFEIGSLLIIMFVVAMSFSVPYLFQRRALALILILVIVVFGLILLFKKKLRIITFVKKSISRYSPGFAETAAFVLDNIIRGTSAIQNIRIVVKVMLLSIVSWGVQICMVKFTADALAIDIDFVASSVVLLIINIGLTVPLAPGNIGTFQVLGIIALSFYSVTKTKALAFSIVYQVIQGIPVIIGGTASLILYLRKRQVSL
jgi:uncharacterized protein (TIRG00374 family)